MKRAKVLFCIMPDEES